MRISPTTLTIPVLLALLTWFLYKGINPDSQRFELTMEALDDFQMTESALHRDILRARAGLLHNYDPIVRKINVLHGTLDRLRAVSAPNTDKMLVLNQLATLVDQQEDLTEKFKTDNALLQNSLAYFELFSVRLGASGTGTALSPIVSRLSAAMLSFTLDTSPGAAQDVQDRLDELAQYPFSAADADAVGTLLAHGRLLHDLLPKTNGVVKALFALPSRHDETALRNLIVSHHAEAREVARRFRVLLYATSLLLVAALAHLAWQLRLRAHALRRRAAFEHVIANISTRFINSRPDEIDVHVEQALIQLARHLDAICAFYMTSEGPTRLYAWSREAIGFAPDWPEKISTRAMDLTTRPEEIVHFPSTMPRLAEGGRGEMDTCAYSWICVVRTGGNGLQNLLCFGLPRPIPAQQSMEFGLLRMALDAISNAIARTTLERERLHLETRLQQARRMEVIGAFASGIAHNFNNIVGAILGYTEIAESQLSSQPSSQGSGLSTLDEIRKAGERARDLVEQILTFGRRRDGRRQKVDMRSLIIEATSLLHASLPSSIELVIGDLPERACILGAPAQLQQLVINLCNNAAQAMDGEGRVEIDLQIQEVAEHRSLTHGELEPGRYICLGVSDTGSGMEDAVLERLFEPFFTTRPTGNGLGLATAREIVHEQGGVMNVETELGVGSRFEAWLPSISIVDVAPTAEMTARPFGRGETLLIIGDDAAQVSADEEMLAALGYEPVGFARAADAMEAYHAQPERFDGVVLGHFASTTSALDLATALRKLTPDLPILLTTPAVLQIDTSLLVASGISDIVRRPVVSSDIAHALKRCLSRSASLYNRLVS